MSLLGLITGAWVTQRQLLHRKAHQHEQWVTKLHNRQTASSPTVTRYRILHCLYYFRGLENGRLFSCFLNLISFVYFLNIMNLPPTLVRKYLPWEAILLHNTQQMPPSGKTLYFCFSWVYFLHIFLLTALCARIHNVFSFKNAGAVWGVSLPRSLANSFLLFSFPVWILHLIPRQEKYLEVIHTPSPRWKTKVPSFCPLPLSYVLCKIFPIKHSCPQKWLGAKVTG